MITLAVLRVHERVVAWGREVLFEDCEIRSLDLNVEEERYRLHRFAFFASFPPSCGHEFLDGACLAFIQY